MTVKSSRASKSVGDTGADGGKPLVIVESPAKAKTINKYLGGGYVVKACKGHVRDLPLRRYGVDPGRNFEPTYEILASHQKVVEELKHAAQKAPVVYLATDLDREGEAIAWHLATALELPPEKIRRVVFNEITRAAVTEAFGQPRQVDMAKVDAQQARRILDRIVGYELSPLLWKKVAKGLSAGRVQSVAVRLIAEREQEIRRFEPQESWTINGVFTADLGRVPQLAAQWRERVGGHDLKENGADEENGGATGGVAKDRFSWLQAAGCFDGSLIEVAGQAFKPEGRLRSDLPKAEAFGSAVEQVRPIAEALGYRVREVADVSWEQYAHLGLRRIELTGETDVTASPDLVVKSIETRRSTSRPSGPFTTATLQQAAANQLRFGTSKTMKIAQTLYEGLDIKTDEGNVGLITYMRTDSTSLSAESLEAVRRLIMDSFGDRYLPEKPNRYGDSKQAQAAHEAIRPTDVRRTPESLRGHLSVEQHRLYALIWNRFVSCQMTPAAWDSTAVLISADTPQGEAVFKATGRVLAFDGFYKVMGVPRNGDTPLLPALREGQRLGVVAIEPQQRFSSPPPRYSEASLVKSLEAEGIGRPSTYAAIIQTIQDRGYVEQMERRFHPTARGEVVTRKLVDHFPKVMDPRFTSHVEDELDKIEERQLDWHDVLHEFYDPFKAALAKAHQEMDAVRAEPSEYVCEVCGRPMVYRLGRKGRFLSCSGYPECSATKDVDRDGKVLATPTISENCDRCGRAMVLRRSRRGPFLGCSGYPECDNTKPCTEDGVPLKKVRPEDIEQTCPECGGRMQVKFSRGRAFLGCSGYPTCKATSPLPEGVYVERPRPQEAGVRCDKCGRPIVIRKGRRGPFLSCSGFPRCRNAMPMDRADELRRLEAEGKIPPPPTNRVNGNGINGGNRGRPGNGRQADGAALGGRRAAGRRGSSTNGGTASDSGPAARARQTSTRTRAKRLSAEEIAALGPPPPGFSWTSTGRPVVEVWPDGPLACFACGGEMAARSGRFGPYFFCDGCKATANLRGEAKKRAEADLPTPQRPKPIDTDITCPECGVKMLLRMGRTGRFLGCSAYPKCRKTMEVPPGLLREVAEAAEAMA